MKKRKLLILIGVIPFLYNTIMLVLHSVFSLKVKYIEDIRFFSVGLSFVLILIWMLKVNIKEKTLQKYLIGLFLVLLNVFGLSYMIVFLFEPQFLRYATMYLSREGPNYLVAYTLVFFGILFFKHE